MGHVGDKSYQVDSQVCKSLGQIKIRPCFMPITKKNNMPLYVVISESPIEVFADIFI